MHIGGVTLYFQRHKGHYFDICTPPVDRAPDQLAGYQEVGCRHLNSWYQVADDQHVLGGNVHLQTLHSSNLVTTPFLHRSVALGRRSRTMTLSLTVKVEVVCHPLVSRQLAPIAVKYKGVLEKGESVAYG